LILLQHFELRILARIGGTPTYCSNNARFGTGDQLMDLGIMEPGDRSESRSILEAFFGALAEELHVALVQVDTTIYWREILSRASGS
jgi:hypothetical protein